MVQLKRTGDWWDVPSDPDLDVDLDYECIELDIIDTMIDGDPQLLVLPRDEDLLREDAFIVIDQNSILDLETMV